MLQDRIDDDMKQAMRDRDKLRLRTLRSLRAALQEKEIELRRSGDEMSEQDVQRVLQKQAKQREEAIAQYEDAEREDLAAGEREELQVIAEYLPEPLTDEEILREIHEVVKATGSSTMKGFGQVMGAVMERVRGRADGKRVQQLVRETLSGSSTS